MKTLSKAMGLLLAILVCQCTNAFALDHQRTRAPRYPSTIPAELVGNLMVITVTWDRHGPWTFVIDTGSSINLVSQEFANRYASHFDPPDIPPVMVQSSHGPTTTIPGVRIKRLQLVAAHFEEFPALVFDFEKISAHLGMKIDGILSFPLFKDVLLTLDYPRSRVVIRNPKTTPEPIGVPVSFFKNLTVPIIPVKFDKTTILTLIDSGNDGVVNLNPTGLNPSFAEAPRPGTSIATITGTYPQQIARVDEDITIGDIAFQKPLVQLTTGLSSIGGMALRNFAVHFDQQKRLVIFSRDETGSISFPGIRSCGLSFTKSKEAWTVISVVPDSPASNLGITPQSTVTKINGEPVANWNINRFTKLVDSSSEIKLTLRGPNGGDPREISVEIFDLIR